MAEHGRIQNDEIKKENRVAAAGSRHHHDFVNTTTNAAIKKQTKGGDSLRCSISSASSIKKFNLCCIAGCENIATESQAINRTGWFWVFGNNTASVLLVWGCWGNQRGPLSSCRHRPRPIASLAASSESRFSSRTHTAKLLFERYAIPLPTEHAAQATAPSTLSTTPEALRR